MWRGFPIERISYRTRTSFLLHFRAIEWYWLWIFDRVVGHLRIHILDNRIREPICRMLKINVCEIEIVRRKFHSFSWLGYKDFYSNILMCWQRNIDFLRVVSGSCWKIRNVRNNIVYPLLFLSAKSYRLDYTDKNCRRLEYLPNLLNRKCLFNEFEYRE